LLDDLPDDRTEEAGWPLEATLAVRTDMPLVSERTGKAPVLKSESRVEGVNWSWIIGTSFSAALGA